MDSRWKRQGMTGQLKIAVLVLVIFTLSLIVLVFALIHHKNGNNESPFSKTYEALLEKELSESISSIQNISDAKVHIAYGVQSSASVILFTKNVTRDQIKAIKNLVASSVPNLSSDCIMIADTSGKLLTSEYVNNIDYKSLYEKRLGRLVESMIETCVGYGNVRAEVRVDMDTSYIDKRYPEDSSNPLNDSDNDINPAENNKEFFINLNFEKNIGEQKQELQEPKTRAMNGDQQWGQGDIRKISAAVMIDVKREGGKQINRDNAEIEKITQIAKATIGFNEKRGDKVFVTSIPFNVASDHHEKQERAFFEKIFGEYGERLIFLIALVYFLFLFLKNRRQKSFAIKNSVNLRSENAKAKPFSLNESFSETKDEGLYYEKIIDLSKKFPDKVAEAIKNMIKE